MGYVPKRKIYRLQFEDPELEGLEVCMRGLNTGQFLDLQGLRGVAEDDDAATQNMFQMMADAIVSWNVTEEDGTAVPASLAGIRQQDMPFNLLIIDAWQTAMTGVPAPLESDSPSGGPSLEVSIPMEPLPESLAS